MRIAEVAQEDGAPALAAGRVGRDRGQRVPALAREVLRGALDLARAPVTDGAQAQRAARLVDPPGLQLDRADALGHRDQRARALAETVERHGEAAVAVAAAGDQGEQAVDVVAAHLGLPDEVRDEPAIGRRVEQHAAGGAAVAPCAAGLLVVALERRRQRPVPDGAHVGLVDAHPERRRGDHHAVVGGHEAGLARVALGRAETGVVGLGGEVGVAQALRDVLAARARAGVDDRRAAARDRPARPPAAPAAPARPARPPRRRSGWGGRRPCAPRPDRAAAARA